MIKRFLSTATVLAIPVFFGLTSCSSLFSDYCKKVMDCRGGNDADRSACSDTLRGQEKAASDYKCSDSFDIYYECLNNTGKCNQGKFETSCGQQGDAYDACVKAASAVR